MNFNGLNQATQEWLDTLILPKPPTWQHLLNRRRQQIAAFSQIEKAIRDLIIQGAQDNIERDDFYDSLMNIWGRHLSRFQGRGFEILGAHSDWNKFATELNRVLQIPLPQTPNEVLLLDQAVMTCIDNLATARVPTRGALLSEFLCHFYPDFYPLHDGPIREWLRQTGYTKLRGRGRTQGAEYIHLAQALRAALTRAPNYPARNMAELDALLI